MSLIQEALRRKDDDDGVPRLTPPPRVIPPINGDVPPVLKLPEQRKSSARIWVAVIFVLAAVLASIVVALGFLLHSTRQIVQSATHVTAPSSQPATPPSRVETPLPPVPEKKVTQITLEPVRTSAPARIEAKPPTPAAVAAEPAAARGPAPVAPASVPATRPAARDTARPPPIITAQPRKSLEGVRTIPVAMVSTSGWPRLNLHGVMAQSGPNQGSAIINGTVVEVGERIDGARLVEVQRNGVLLEFKSSTQFVRVGQSTF